MKRKTKPQAAKALPLYSVSPGGSTVFQTEDGIKRVFSESNCEEDAAFIVRAANNYQSIVEAAKYVIENWVDGDLARAVNDLQDALRAAGEDI